MHDFWDALIIVAAPIAIATGAIAGTIAGSVTCAQSAFPRRAVVIMLVMAAYVVTLIVYLGSRV
jgi:hypothetical protein